MLRNLSLLYIRKNELSKFYGDRRKGQQAATLPLALPLVAPFGAAISKLEQP